MDMAPYVFEMRTDDDVMRYIGRPKPTSIADVIGMLQSNLESMAKQESLLFGMEEKSTGLHLGTIGFWRTKPEHFRAELGYMLRKSHWGKGLVSEAIAEIVRYTFAQTNLHSIEAEIDPKNLASARVLEKNGFVKEAHFKENFYWNGQFEDSAIYSLVKKK
jgi:ribosomal-protein-alanine N-acetyltransferase